MIEEQYGLWKSSIDAYTIQKYQSSYDYLTIDQCNEEKYQNIIYWTETKPECNGRIVLYSYELENSEITQWTSKEYSVRSRVHEYGGAAFFVHKSKVYFSNDSDQCLYEQESSTSTPKQISRCSNTRYSNGYFSTKLNTIFIVREDHRNRNSIQNTIVIIENSSEHILLEGSDFYSSPRVNQSGTKLCWIEWKFPNMPWDNTRCCIAQIKSSNSKVSLSSIQVVCTGSEKSNISCTLPMWSYDDHLIYIKDITNFWNVWIRDTDLQEINVTPYDEDIGDPMWLMDYRKYNYSELTNEIVCCRPGALLEFYHLKTMAIRRLDCSHMFNYMSYPYQLPDGSVIVRAHSPQSLPSIYQIFNDGSHKTLGRNGSIEELDNSWISEPQHITYQTSDGSYVHGYFYPPRNPEYQPPADSQGPPLLVIAHGGPTGSTFTNLNMSIQYWTSRGFAIFDVNYRGSTGYGKVYRNSLHGNWGVYDVDDCCYGADYLTEQGLVNGQMRAIKGGSAGGYLTLCCAVFRNVFQACSSLYGIGDLNSLVKNTHKFESRYTDLLIGRPEDNSQLYKERSPINYPEKIKSPIIFFQGSEDKVVPLDQAEGMYKAVKSAGVPCKLKIYQGEQHGFRIMANIENQLETEYKFLITVFRLSDCLASEIENWPW